MRSKVVLIKGRCDLPQMITAAEFERIDADDVVLIAALRRKQFLPPDWGKSPIQLCGKSLELLQYWRSAGCEHVVASEYAVVAIDHGRCDVRAVDGDALTFPWFYETVKAIHRQFGQVVVEAEVIYHPELIVRIEDRDFTVAEAAEFIGPAGYLG